MIVYRDLAETSFDSRFHAESPFFPVGKVVPKGRTVPGGFSESPCTWELAVFYLLHGISVPHPPPSGEKAQIAGMIVTKQISFQPVLRQGIPRNPRRSGVSSTVAF